MKRRGIVLFAHLLTTLVGVAFGQSRTVELKLATPPSAALSDTRVTLILEDETTEGARPTRS